MFYDQPNLYQFHPSLHLKCYHQSIYSKLNSNTEHQPPYEHLVWDHKRTNVEGIKSSTEPVNWEVMLNNNSVPKRVPISNVTLMNTSSNFTPNLLCLTIGTPPFPRTHHPPHWMNDFVKSKNKWKNQFYKIYTKNSYKCNS